MIARRHIVPLIAALLLFAAYPASAQNDGHVQIPLSAWQDLVGEQSSTPSWALGSANVSASVQLVDGSAWGTVTTTVSVQVLDAGTVLVPLLASGTAVRTVFVDGTAAALVTTPGGLALPLQNAGTRNVQLEYRVDARRYGDGWVLDVPVPTATSTSFSAQLPGGAVAPSVVPASSVSAGTGYVSAQVPTTSAVQVTWRGDSAATAVTSRASYRGTVGDAAISWRATYIVDVADGRPATLPLLPRSVALVEVRVDDDEAPVVVQDGEFVVRVGGEGRHTIDVGFETPIVRGNGPPGVDMTIPAVPVSRFELVLPGDKEVTVTPASSVTITVEDGATTALAHVPMTSQVQFTWSEAVPEDALEEELRASAEIFHTAYAEEGVLYGTAEARFEITRGATSQLVLSLPDDVQVNRVSSASGAVSDWRADEETGELTLYLDREVSGAFACEVTFERLIGTGERALGSFSVPLFTARDVSRQRGMVALLASDELTLEPTDEGDATRVGENQLPPELLDRIEQRVAHTFRYLDAAPTIVVEPRVPERQQGRFDASVDTLISLDDVTTEASASVAIDVKAGTITALTLHLPADVNVLHLTAPSMRGYEVEDIDGAQQIEVEFTRELEGQLRVELSYEQILGEAGGEVSVPLVRVDGAEVQQGRVAVEALTAVEVQPARAENVSSMEIDELPRQLLMRTTNPILLAWKYVQMEPPPLLSLTVTRHRELELRDATIDRAEYTTLYTTDGFAVTTARFVVRNSRQQFLRVALPRGSEVWSATVAGQSETPALDESGEDGSVVVLVPIVNAEEGFPVELVYQTPVPALGALGQVSARLPRPAMVVTETRWEVYLPQGYRYAEPRSDLELVTWGMVVTGDELDMGGEGPAGRLQFEVPTEGVQVVFEKLYATQLEGDIGFSATYTTAAGDRIGAWAGGAAGVLLALGLLGGIGRRGRKVLRAVLVVVALAAAAGAVFVVGIDPMIPLIAAGVTVVIWLFLALLAVARRRWRASSEDEHETSAAPATDEGSDTEAGDDDETSER